MSMTTVSGPRYILISPEAYQQPFAPSQTLRLQSLTADAGVGERSISNR